MFIASLTSDCLTLRLSSRISRQRRGGFTLVELLVVIAIIGTLISMLLPAVQAAREAARRMQCANNIRQLALSAGNYESATGKLPPSATLDPSEKSYQGDAYPVADHHSGKVFSWAVTLLPYVEQNNLYDRFDFSRSIFDQPLNPQAESISTFRCPSDIADQSHFSDEKATQGRRFAKGNYAAYVSPYHIDLQLLYPGALISTGQSLGQIIDGTSHTFVFSEVRTLDSPQDERGAWALPWAGSSVLSFDMHHKCDAASDSCPDHSAAANFCPWERYYRPSPCSLGFTQTPNSTGGPVKDTILNCQSGSMQQNLSDFEGMPCTESIWPIGLYGYYSASPRSLHPGGVNVAFLDGHVGFIRDDVDEFSFAYRVSINDGQTSEDDD